VAIKVQLAAVARWLTAPNVTVPLREQSSFRVEMLEHHDLRMQKEFQSLRQIVRGLSDAF